MKRRVTFLLAAALALPGITSAQFWETKDYKAWSAAECRKMLEDSPWAKRYTAYQVGNIRLDYTAQIRSALPIRQAIVRLAQINNKYDQMTPEQKKPFDEAGEAYLAREYPDRIVIHAEFNSADGTYERELKAYWQTYPVIPKTDVYLTGLKNRQVLASRFVSDKGAGRAFEFTFPRQADGEPLIQQDVKALMVEFQHPALRYEGPRVIGGPTVHPGTPPQRVYFEFTVEKMNYRGQLAY